MSSITLTVETATIQLGFWAPTASGEANDCINVGSAIEVFKQKTGDLFEFRTLQGQGGIDVRENGDIVEIDGSGSGGGGGVTGPASSTDSAVALWDGTGGSVVKNSAVTINPSGDITTPGTVDGRDVATDGVAQDAHIASMANPHGVSTAQIGAIPTIEKGAANGVAELDGSGEVPIAQIPATIARDADLQAHITDVANPHSVTPAQVGNTSAQWNASQLQSRPVDGAAPALGNSLVYDGSKWAPSVPAGGGDVSGPASANDDGVCRFDGTSGKVIQDTTGVTINDGGDISVPALATVDGRDVSVDGAALDAHIADSANPHFTSIGNLGVGTLAQLNTAVTDATLDDSGDSRPPDAHAIGGADHTASTLAQLNAKVSDATLDDSGDARAPTAHASSHENGGSDELDVAGLSGALADPQTPSSHAATHQDGGSDELEVEDLPTSSVDTSHVLKPDGAGGVAFGAVPQGVKQIDSIIGDFNANLGNYRTRSVGSAGAFSMSVRVPHDFGSLVEIYALCSPLADVVAGDIDLSSDYGGVGESITTHQETDTTSTFNLTGGEWNKLDLSSVFSSLAAGDNCGCNVDHNGVGTTVHYTHVVLRYNPA